MLPLILINVSNTHNVHKYDQLFPNRMIFHEIESFQGNALSSEHFGGEITEALHSEFIIYVLISDT